MVRRVKEVFEEGKGKEEVGGMVEGDWGVVHVIEENEEVVR
ncbi:hypothetical protein [Bacillus thuringiensis]|nr:hypothetical protein [Bacillus thuringiensis]